MGLERPLVLRLDHLGGRPEGLIHIAVVFLHGALANRGLADVVVQRRLGREWRGKLRPFHLDLLYRLDGIPFPVRPPAAATVSPTPAAAAGVLCGDFVPFYPPPA